MSDSGDFRGIWTYRSFANTPGVIGDLSKLKMWEAELSLEVVEGSRVYGFLGERPEVASGDEPYLLVEGKIVAGDPTTIRWRAKGRPQSQYDRRIYDYIGYLVPDWPDATHPRPAIVGTVTCTVTDETGLAGSVFSFIAIKSDFLEPRIVIPLANPVIDMLASTEHRHHHALWHASRD